MSPRYAGNSQPSFFSVFSERGLANCPAIRPTLTTGTLAPYISDIVICSNTRKKLRRFSSLNSAKLSAQSPPCSKNALPKAASASSRLSARDSPGEASGGKLISDCSTCCNCFKFLYSGCCLIGKFRQLSGVQSAAFVGNRLVVICIRLKTCYVNSVLI